MDNLSIAFKLPHDIHSNMYIHIREHNIALFSQLYEMHNILQRIINFIAESSQSFTTYCSSERICILQAYLFIWKWQYTKLNSKCIIVKRIVKLIDTFFVILSKYFSIVKGNTWWFVCKHYDKLPAKTFVNKVSHAHFPR